MKGPFHLTVVRVVHMKRNAYEGLKDQLDALTRRIDELDVEFWFARELMTVLGYSRWENFVVALHRAITSCNSMGHDPEDHFRGVTKLVVEIVMVSRYEYGIAQRMENGSTIRNKVQSSCVLYSPKCSSTL